MGLKRVLGEIRKKLKGSLAIAKANGMVVEDGVTVMGDVNFGSEPYLITLRKNCRITNGTIFITHDGGTWAFRNKWTEYKEVISFGRIEIGEETFIGARTIIMPGVIIGKNCVIGAGSVVTKSIPDESVACGVPAKIIRTTKEYADKCKERMPVDFNHTEYKRNKKYYLSHNL